MVHLTLNIFFRVHHELPFHGYQGNSYSRFHGHDETLVKFSLAVPLPKTHLFWAFDILLDHLTMLSTPVGMYALCSPLHCLLNLVYFNLFY